jgi:probable phosphoglycerate mutase
MISTRVVVVRHGETEWNRLGKQQGHLDSPLTELGRRQAEVMAAGLKTHQIDCFYASDLGRAVQTADIISREIGLPYTTDSRLRERHLGVMQGLTMEEFARKYPEEAVLYHDTDPDYRIPEGESIRDRYRRHVAGLEDLAARHPGKTVLVVAHGGVLISFLHKALDLPLSVRRRAAILNAAINVFIITDNSQWRLETWGETAHLRTAGLTSLDDF